MLELEPRQISSHTKVGKVGDDSVFHICTKGGLHVYARLTGKKVHVLGAGQHQALARHLARKEEPRMVLTELQKSEEPLMAHEMASGLPIAREITRLLRG